MKTILALTLLAAAVIIVMLWEKLKDQWWLNRQLLADAPASKPPFDVERMVAARQQWSNQMTAVDRREGRQNWRYKFAEKKFQQASAALINNMDVDMTTLESASALQILDSLEENN